MLLFKKKFLPAIRSGEKTQTIRLWNVCRMKAGQRSYIPGAGYIRVISVEPVELPSLSDDDARPDGFATADALRQRVGDALCRANWPPAIAPIAFASCCLSSDEQAAAVAAQQGRQSSHQAMQTSWTSA